MQQPRRPRTSLISCSSRGPSKAWTGTSKLSKCPATALAKRAPPPPRAGGPKGSARDLFRVCSMQMPPPRAHPMLGGGCILSGQVQLVGHLQNQIRHMQECNGRLYMDAQHAARAAQEMRDVLGSERVQHGGTIARMAAIKKAAAAADASRRVEAEKSAASVNAARMQAEADVQLQATDASAKKDDASRAEADAMVSKIAHPGVVRCRS